MQDVSYTTTTAVAVISATMAILIIANMILFNQLTENNFS